MFAFTGQRIFRQRLARNRLPRPGTDTSRIATPRLAGARSQAGSVESRDTAGHAVGRDRVRACGPRHPARTPFAPGFPTFEQTSAVGNTRRSRPHRLLGTEGLRYPPSVSAATSANSSGVPNPPALLTRVSSPFPAIPRLTGIPGRNSPSTLSTPMANASRIASTVSPPVATRAVREDGPPRPSTALRIPAANACTTAPGSPRGEAGTHATTAGADAAGPDHGSSVEHSGRGLHDRDFGSPREEPSGLLLRGPGPTIGVDDLVIVDAGDALLVCHRDRTQDVREVVEQLKREGGDAHL